jgi:RNA polymerase sigma factor (sigma-70 family)
MLELFSTFAVLEGAYFQRWVVDARLRRSMQGCIDQRSEISQSDKVWALYWFKQWQPHNLAEVHLSAYLQESCYWVAHQIAQRLKSNQYLLTDYFQMANGEIPRVLRSFVPDRGIALKSYASTVLTNALKDILRQRQAADIASDWSLLRKVSKKRIAEVIAHAGVADAEQYQRAWFCFKTLYVPSEAPGETLSRPSAEVWNAIAQAYNSQGLPLTPDQLELRLSQLSRWIRAYLYPSVDSLNRPLAGQETGELQDTLADAEAESLLDQAIAQEAQIERDSLRSRIHILLSQTLVELKPELQIVLDLCYRQKLSQQELAVHLNTSQPTVSRRLKKAEAALLDALLNWCAAQFDRYLNPGEVQTLSAALREWLTIYFVTALR